MCFADRGIKKELFSERKPAAQNVRRTEGSRAEALAGVWGGAGPQTVCQKRLRLRLQAFFEELSV